MDISTCYRLLELEPGATRQAVDAAYCRLVERWQPPAAGGFDNPQAAQEAQRHLREINEAYHTLAKVVPASAKPTLAPLHHAEAVIGRPPPPRPPAESWEAVRPASAPTATPEPTAPSPTRRASTPAGGHPASPRPPSAAAERAPDERAPTADAPLATAPAPAASPLVASPTRRWLPFLALGGLAVALLTLLAVCTAGSSTPRGAASPPDPATVSQLTVRTNRPDSTVEVTHRPTTDTATPAAIRGPATEGAPAQTLTNLPPGEYEVVARSAGWSDQRAKVTLVASQSTEVSLTFPSGSLRVDSLPTGANVRFGNALVGRTPLTIPQLPVGECELTLEYPLWPNHAFRATIVEGEEAVAHVRMPHGRLVLESVPSGATVFLGQKPLGVTPLTFERFQAGTKTLAVQHPDFPPLDVTVTMADEGDVILRPVLATSLPALDPLALLSAVWVETRGDDANRIAPGFTDITGFRSRNGIVRNLNRKKLWEQWLNRKYRYAGVVRQYNRETGELEFAEQGEATKFRVVAPLSPAARNDRDIIAALTRGASIAVYGTLVAVEEPSRAGRAITLEFASAEVLPLPAN